MALTNTYSRMRNVSSATNEKSIVGTYQDYFEESPPQITNAQNLVINNTKQFLVLLANKLSGTDGLQTLVTAVQNHWFSFVNTILSFVGRRNKTISEYSASSTYEVGDICTKSNVTYMCITAITTAEAWNLAHWKMISPNSFGFTWANKIRVNANNGFIALVDANDSTVEYARMLSDLIYLNNESDAVNGMVYLIDIE